MFKKGLIIPFLIYSGITFAQSNYPDSIAVNDSASITAADEWDDLDDITLSELESFLDSLLSPRSYLFGSLQIGKGYYNYESKTSYLLETSPKLTYSPVIGYYHKSGLGVNASAYIISEEKRLNPFQFSIGPTFDFLKNKNFATGISYTRYFTKDSLNFYTTPLQNELFAYFTWRKSWFRPSVSFNYGWGSRSDYYDREVQINSLRLRRWGFTRINTMESIKDFSLMASVRHDFYWLEVLGKNDHVRITPQILFTSGTQKFGFNQSANIYTTSVRGKTNVLYNTSNSLLTDQTAFEPLSLTFLLRTEYSFGKFFVQPQCILDYYFPADKNNFNTIFTVSTGFML